MSDDTKDQINGLNNTVNTLFQSYVQEIFLNKDSKSLKKDRKNAAQSEIGRFVRHIGAERDVIRRAISVSENSISILFSFS